MKIITFKKKNKNIYELILDNNQKIELYDDIILKYDLLLQKEIKKQSIEVIMQENKSIESYYAAVHYLIIKMRTYSEIVKYLIRKGYSQNEIDYTIERFRKEKLIDENKYIDAFIIDSINLTSKGPNKIKRELLKLGLDESIINQKINEIDSNIWNEKINKIITKKLKLNKKSINEFKNKTYFELIALGYDITSIKNILEKTDFGEETNFKVNADKEYNKLIKKFDTKTALFKLKSKLYKRGYESDLISNYIEEKK